MDGKATIIISLSQINKPNLQHIMEIMEIKPEQIKFVLDNIDNPDYLELIKGFLNKEVTFAQLKKAVK